MNHWCMGYSMHWDFDRKQILKGFAEIYQWDYLYFLGDHRFKWFFNYFGCWAGII